MAIGYEEVLKNIRNIEVPKIMFGHTLDLW